MFFVDFFMILIFFPRTTAIFIQTVFRPPFYYGGRRRPTHAGEDRTTGRPPARSAAAEEAGELGHGQLRGGGEFGWHTSRLRGCGCGRKEDEDHPQ